VPIAVLCWLGLVPGGLVGGLVALAIFGVLGLLGYLVVALRLGIEEARSLADVVRRRLPSRRRAEGAAP